MATRHQPDPGTGPHRATQAFPDGVKLSVIIPVYNERRLVAELLRRVLAVRAPGLRELEVIAVDDGSGWSGVRGVTEVVEA